MFYIIWATRITAVQWPDQINEMQAWLLCEVLAVGFNLLSGVIFLVFAYVSKMDNFMRDSAVIKSNQNPWNTKKTDDFARHLKAEMHTIVYPLIIIMMESHMLAQPASMTLFFVLCLITRAISLVCLLLLGWLHYNWDSERFKIQRLAMAVIDICVFVALIILYLGNEEGWA